MINLLKKATLGLALAATSLSFGQATINFNSSGSATKVLTTDGTLDAPIIFTITGIPEGLTTGTTNDNKVNVRLYTLNTDVASTVVTAGGQALSSADMSMGSGDADLTGDIVTSSTTPVGGFFNRTYTINKLVTGAVDGTDYVVAIRVIKAGSTKNNTMVDDGAPVNAITQNSGSGTSHIIYALNTTVQATTSLSTSIVKSIEGASVTAENGSITASGAEIDAVYSITGQQVNTDSLANGIYIVKISKGNKQGTVKVIME